MAHRHSALLPGAWRRADGTYRKQLNPSNPLGTGGRLAEAYAQLVKQIWYGGDAVLAPTNFKVCGVDLEGGGRRACCSCRYGHATTMPLLGQNAIAQFAPQFIGNDQHDAQELLLFLLDGLHEDVNVVRHKPPPIEDPDSDGTNFTDKELAAISWSNYLRRTDSQVLRLFQGQFRSTVSCLTCGKVGQRWSCSPRVSV